MSKIDAPSLKKFLNTPLTWNIFKRLIYARFRVQTSLHLVNIQPNSKLLVPHQNVLDPLLYTTYNQMWCHSQPPSPHCKILATLVVTALTACPFSTKKCVKKSVFYVKTAEIRWRLGATPPDLGCFPPFWPNPKYTTACGGDNFLNRPGRQNLRLTEPDPTSNSPALWLFHLAAVDTLQYNFSTYNHLNRALSFSVEPFRNMPPVNHLSTFS